MRAIQLDFGVAWDYEISYSDTSQCSIELYDTLIQNQRYLWKAFLEVFSALWYFEEMSAKDILQAREPDAALKDPYLAHEL